MALLGFDQASQEVAQVGIDRFRLNLLVESPQSFFHLIGNADDLTGRFVPLYKSQVEGNGSGGRSLLPGVNSSLDLIDL